jgi:NAD(P)H-hydrate epimerase
MQIPADGLRRVTREEMKLIDTMATTAFGIPGLALMENAGREVAESLQTLLREGGTAAGRVLVFASPGNNGGDGCVAARHLASAGWTVSVFLVGRNPDTLTHDTATNLKILKRMGLKVEELRTPVAVQQALPSFQGCVAAVDALLGTGFSAISGEVKEPIASVIDAVNALGVSVVSADIPSGLDGNTGQVLGRAIRATWTVTFGLPKVGFFAPGAAASVGRLSVTDIGLPRALLDGKSFPSVPVSV